MKHIKHWIRFFLRVGLISAFGTLAAQDDRPKPVTVDGAITPSTIQKVQRKGNSTIVTGNAATTLQSGGQVQEGSENALWVDSDLAAYRFAKGIRDYQSAAEALIRFIVLHPKATHYQDSLVALYFHSANFTSCTLLGKRLLDQNPKNLLALEYLALSYSVLGMHKEALDYYERLQRETKSSYHLYQVAALQYQMERFGECRSSLKSLLLLPEAKTELIEINGQSAQYQVPLAAAVHNLMGNLEQKCGNKKAAKSHFDQALELAPDFEMARNNRAAL